MSRVCVVLDLLLLVHTTLSACLCDISLRRSTSELLRVYLPLPAIAGGLPAVVDLPERRHFDYGRTSGIRSESAHECEEGIFWLRTFQIFGSIVSVGRLRVSVGIRTKRAAGIPLLWGVTS